MGIYDFYLFPNHKKCVAGKNFLSNEVITGMEEYFIDFPEFPSKQG